jgi:ribosomal protein S27E
MQAYGSKASNTTIIFHKYQTIIFPACNRTRLLTAKLTVVTKWNVHEVSKVLEILESTWNTIVECVVCTTVWLVPRGVRKLLKVGGGEGHFKKILTSQKNFPDIPHFFVNMKNIFRIFQKFFPDIWNFSRKWKKFSGNNIHSSFQKCPLGKKCNLNDNF